MIQLYTWNTALEVHSKGRDKDDIVCIQEKLWAELAEEPRELKGKDRKYYEIVGPDNWVWVIPRECAYEVKSSKNLEFSGA